MNKTSLLIAGFTIALVIFFYWLLKSILVYLGIAFVLAIIGRPLINLLEKIKFKKFRMKRGLASFITLLAYYSVIFFLFSLLAPYVIQEAKSLSEISPNEVINTIKPIVETVEEQILSITGNDFSVEAYLKEKVIALFDMTNISNFLNSITSMMGNIFVAFFAISFMAFFFMKDGQNIINNILRLLPKYYREELTETFPEIKEKLTRYFAGIGLQITIIFLCLFTGLWVVGVENFVLIAVISAFMNVIPYVGPLIGAAIGLSLTVATGYQLDFYTELMPMILYVGGIYLCTQLLDNIVLQPLIYSNSVNVHPLEIFVVILVAGNLFGILGMVLATPAYAIIRIFIKEIRNSSAFVQKMYD
jgi:predicted PurR-regulated permease PerM